MKRYFSIFEAKARLSELIRIVKERHEVIITDRSRPVVRMVPFSPPARESLSQRMQTLERAGQLSPVVSGAARPKQQKGKRDLLEKFLEERD